MPAVTEINFEAGTISSWAAKMPTAGSYLQEVQLAPCTSEAPAACPLRGSFELPWGATPGAAIRSLLSDIDPSEWPDEVALRLFDFSGPLAEVDDLNAEEDLLSPLVPSPLWTEIRASADQRKVGLIRLNQLQRMIVPVFALRASGAELEWVPRCRESVLRPELAFEANETAW